MRRHCFRIDPTHKFNSIHQEHHQVCNDQIGKYFLNLFQTLNFIQRFFDLRLSFDPVKQVQI